MAMNAADIASRWQNGMAGASEKMRQGIDAVTTSPTEKAASAVDRMLAGLQRAIAEGKVQRGLRRITLEGWKKAAKEKGIPRVASGAAAAKPNVQDFFQEFIPHLEGVVRGLESMPRGDLEQNIARASFVMRENAKFRRS